MSGEQCETTPLGKSAKPARLHLIKLSVGSESVESLREWQAKRSTQRKNAGLDPRPRHITRMWPRRAGEILGGGSIYWVISGVVAARQTLDEFEEIIGEDGIRRCGFVLDPQIIPVEPRPRRPFQGWRYLKPEDAPRDLKSGSKAEAALPSDLRSELGRFGVR